MEIHIAIAIDNKKLIGEGREGKKIKYEFWQRKNKKKIQILDIRNIRWLFSEFYRWRWEFSRF
jgi:hypothetical protein